jgi:DNA replication ATP-dependent helicase Dna2
VGDLLKDWRRINVSLTRAKSKLILFGSKSTLIAIPLLKKFFDVVEEKKWIYQLEKGDVEIHHGVKKS